MGISGICIRAGNETGTIALGQNQLNAVQENINVIAATPLMTSVNNIKVRSKLYQCVVWGIDSNADEIVSLDLLYGRMINKTDIIQNAKVCIVDESFAKNTYHRSNIVGKTITLSMNNTDESFTVVGIVSSGGSILQGVMGDMVPSFLYAPFTTISTISQANGFSQIIAKLNTTVDEEFATNSIIRELAKTENQIKTVNIESLNQQKEKLNGLLDIVTLILAAVGSISLLVAGLSIMTVMLVTVNERTREIGIKKSIGATKATIMSEFLVEALILSLVGSIIGAVLGSVIGIIGALILHVPIVINFRTIFLCIGFCVLIGIVFGVYPAIKAAKLKPVDALRFE